VGAPAALRAAGIIIPKGSDKFDNFGILLRGITRATPMIRISMVGDVTAKPME
jgi:hypothetical protein